MKIWYDACTGKQVRYGIAISKRLRALGHKVKLTTRDHKDTLPLADLLKEKIIKVGKYDPTSLLSSLRESSKRQVLFCKMFEDNKPDLAISHRSVELCRVAFGLQIPNISTHDTTHAKAVNKLTMPLIGYLVVSKALPKQSLKGYGRKKIYWFDGVDEVAWIREFKPKIKYNYGKPLIVVREMEEKAAYAQGKENWTKILAKKLTRLGKVLFLPRYNQPLDKELLTPKDFIDSASIVSEADLVVSAGGTIAREAALQGVSTIVVSSFGRLYVNDYLSSKGFPIYTVNLDQAFTNAKKILGKRKEVRGLLKKLENPVDVIEEIIIKEEFK
jgi:predicted glycosyltransferase